MYIATGFVILVHSFIQVIARAIDYILFIRALGVSMWKQLVKVLQLKYPTISYTIKLYEGNKKNTVNSNFTSQNAKSAFQNQKKFSPAAGYKPPFAGEIITKLFCDDNSNAGYSQIVKVCKLGIVGNIYSMKVFLYQDSVAK